MARKIRTHLMFDGTADEAMRFYVGLFPESDILDVAYYKDGENRGKVAQASFTLNGREFICIDTPVKHNFTFTPATSIFVDCESMQELERVFGALSKGGQVLMPLDDYGFSRKFGWISDRFGVSWQVNLPHEQA
ncbi:MAG: VOC family protein [Bacteroidetes bacterium]|nr:VOC family protein [Bacteroidota bacterium]